MVGLVLIVFPVWRGWTWDRGVLRDIGIAILSASILGFTIDVWLKSEIVRDVFEAALGYVFRPEFREEIRRITGYKLLCDKHLLSITLEKIPDGRVRMTTGVERRIRNISADKQTLRGLIHVDEWGASEKSKILECHVLAEDGRQIAAFVSAEELPDQTLKAQTDEVEINPSRFVTTHSKSVEIKHINDDTDWTFGTPTINATITINKPDDLECDCWFGTAPEERSKSQYSPIYSTNQTYFPNQRMRVRWWPKIP